MEPQIPGNGVAALGPGSFPGLAGDNYRPVAPVAGLLLQPHHLVVDEAVQQPLQGQLRSVCSPCSNPPLPPLGLYFTFFSSKL